METILKNELEYHVVYFSGRLDAAAAPETETAVKPTLDVTNRDIILDCTHLTYISSSGLRIFLTILKHAKEIRRHVYIRNVNDSIVKVFKMVGFYNLFEFK